MEKRREKSSFSLVFMKRRANKTGFSDSWRNAAENHLTFLKRRANQQASVIHGETPRKTISFLDYLETPRKPTGFSDSW